MSTFDPDGRGLLAALPPLGARAFRRLCELVYENSGVVVREEAEGLLQRRLAPRLEALGLRDFGAYLEVLERGADRNDELDALLDAATTHETYFFREPHQLDSFVEEVLPGLARDRRETRRLRLWSAGCASGEEAYTLAMLVLESGLFDGWDVSIFGTDVTRRMLVKARLGEYSEAALRATTPLLRRRYFEPAGAGRWRVTAAPRARVTFAHVNLMDPMQAALLPPMDAIFCRNVLIYLDQPARLQVLQVLYDRLVEGGFLLLGHAENLLSVDTDFELVHLERDLIYRRPRAREGP